MRSRYRALRLRERADDQQARIAVADIKRFSGLLNVLGNPRGVTGKMTRHAPTPEHLSLLVGKHRRFLAFLERWVGSASDAEDILQKAFPKSVDMDRSV